MKIIKCSRGQSLNDLIDAIETRIDDLSGKQYTASATSAHQEDEIQPDYASFLNKTMEAVKQNLDKDIRDGLQYTVEASDIIVTIPYANKILQFDVPIADLTITDTAFDSNVNYIVDNIEESL